MAERKKRYWFFLGIAAFLAYVFAAARTIPPETVMAARWLSSLESSLPVKFEESPENPDTLIPFQFGGHFGYIGDDGVFSLNQILKNYVSISQNYWSEYEALPSSIQIQNPQGGSVIKIENPQGYPFFAGGNMFLLGKRQDTLTALDENGKELWSYEFPAPLTCVDSASGFVLAGTLDGTVELLNSAGRQLIPPFEPGGSRLTVILGCAISRDGSRFAVISGIDDQRFLLLEQSGDRYRVVYHEYITRGFISKGFRHPVHISFIDNDSRVVYEKEGGLGIYEIASKTSFGINLEGEIAAIDKSGTDGIFFVITSPEPGMKSLAAIQYPGNIIMKAPFKSSSCFFSRNGSAVYLGGDMGILSLELGEK
ncbi:MAG: WD40 repeat domain-containing protein [Treponema sp.]|nr:WD40 repeat domain-containing protein [Treponema sp.]